MRYALTLALSLRVSIAVAQYEGAEAEQQRGVQLRAQGRDAEAAEVFRAIFERSGEPRALARLGLAEGALGRWADADEHLGTALTRDGDPWIRANRASLEQALALVRTHLGTLVVTCAAPGATVQLGAEAPQPLPLRRPLRVTTGFVTLVVRAPGHRPLERRVAVPMGEAPIQVEATLSPEAVPAASTTATAPPTRRPRSPAQAIAPAPVVAPSAPTPRRATWHRPAGIGLFVGGGVALGLGVLGAALREGGARRFNQSGCLLHPTRDELTTNTAACRDALESTRDGAGMSVGGFVAAGVLAAAGATLFLLAPRASETVTVGVGVDPTGARGALTLRF